MRHTSLLCAIAASFFIYIVAASAPVRAAIVPVTTSVRGIALARVDPNLEHAPDSHLDSKTSGDVSVTSHDSDTFTDPDGTLLSDVSITGDGHVSADGASGTSMLHSVWTATNSRLPGRPNQGGAFSIDMQFFYSFSNTSPMTISIDVTTSLTGTGDVGLGEGAMSNGHTITFDGQASNLQINGPTHLEFSVAPTPPNTPHELKISHAPNFGLNPWPTVEMTLNSDISFSIVPEPATGVMLAAFVAPLLPRRRTRKFAPLLVHAS